MHKLTLLVASFLCATAAQADELVIHTGSYHADSSYTHEVNYWDQYGNYLYTTRNQVTYNNFNPGVGYKFNNGVSVGGYFNSYRKPTMYVAKEWMMVDYFGVIAGLATGYDRPTGHTVTPMAGFIFKQKITERDTANLEFAPSTGRTTGTIHLAISRSFK
jgi:hypothetical protein